MPYIRLASPGEIAIRLVKDVYGVDGSQYILGSPGLVVVEQTHAKVPLNR